MAPLSSRKLRRPDVAGAPRSPPQITANSGLPARRRRDVDRKSPWQRRSPPPARRPTRSAWRSMRCWSAAAAAYARRRRHGSGQPRTLEIASLKLAGCRARPGDRRADHACPVRPRRRPDRRRRPLGFPKASDRFNAREGRRCWPHLGRIASRRRSPLRSAPSSRPPRGPAGHHADRPLRPAGRRARRLHDRSQGERWRTSAISAAARSVALRPSPAERRHRLMDQAARPVRRTALAPPTTADFAPRLPIPGRRLGRSPRSLRVGCGTLLCSPAAQDGACVASPGRRGIRDARRNAGACRHARSHRPRRRGPLG